MNLLAQFRKRFDVFQQLMRFGIVGVASTLAHVFMTLFTIETVGMSPVLGNSMGFALSFIISYLGNSLWTFMADTAFDKTLFSRYVILACTGFVFNSTIMAGATLVLGLPHRVALIFIIFTWPALSFLMSRHWIFKPDTKADSN